LGWALFGRGSSDKFPPLQAIKDWILRKPIQISGSDRIDSVAYLIARKIKNSGTNPPKLRPQNLDLVINQLGNKYMPTLGRELADELATQIAKTTDTRKL
jgi:hypothetical protein